MFLLLLLFTSLSFVLGQFGRVQLGDSIAFSLMDVGVFLSIIFWSIAKVRRRDITFSWNKTYLFVILFLLIGILGLFLSPLTLSSNERLVAFLYPLRLSMYGGIFFVIKSLSAKEKSYILLSQIGVGAVLVGVGIIQYFYYPFLRNLYYLGWDDHLYRLFSTFLDPNFAGSFFVLFFLFLCGFVVQLIKTGRKKAVLGYSLLSLIVLIAIMLTYSRTAFVMLLVGGGVLFALLHQWKVIIAGGIGVVVLFLLFANTSLEGLNPLRVASTVARLDSAKEASAIFSDNPVLGVGFNAYRYAQIQMGFRSPCPAMPSHADSGTDNVYLFVLATTGIVGFSLFLLFFFSVFKNLISGIKKPDMVYEVMLSSLVAVLVGSLFINLLFYPAIMMWLAVLGGLTQKE